MPERLVPVVKPFLWLLATVTTFAIGYADLRHEVRDKASKSELRSAQDSVNSEQRQLQAELQEIGNRVQRTEQMVQRLVCRQLPDDLSCR